MSATNSDENELAASSVPPLSLPQNCTPQERSERDAKIAVGCEEYEFDHAWSGYPPSINRLPKAEKPLLAMIKLLESGLHLGIGWLKGWWHRFTYWITHPFGSKDPFAPYIALYEGRNTPEVGRDGEWKKDSFFAAQRLNGMYPWFIERLEDLAELQKEFPITDAMLKGLLPGGVTLADLQADGRLYVVKQSSLNGAEPAHGHVMTAPTTLFWVDNTGTLLPLGIQLYPDGSTSTPIFTPNDDLDTWLGVKIHASCADSLVHSVYSHAILMHFIMCNVWTAANRSLAPSHPIHAFLKPHFWSTLFITRQVKNTMDKPAGQQCEVYGTGYTGQNTMVNRLYQDFDFRSYDPHFDFEQRGVLDGEKLPNFHYRDDAIRLWDADHSYIEKMMDLFYKSDEDVQQDTELASWVSEMTSEEGAGINGLPLHEGKNLRTRAQLHQLLTSIVFTVSSRHSSIENEALKFLYVPNNPFIYRLEAPTSASQQIPLETVATKLPPFSKVVMSNALIAAADFDAEKFGLLGKYPDGFMAGSPHGVQAVILDWKRELKKISASIDARNEKLDIPYTGMNPRVTFNSIWN
jgi:hypothetical protein